MYTKYSVVNDKLIDTREKWSEKQKQENLTTRVIFTCNLSQVTFGSSNLHRTKHKQPGGLRMLLPRQRMLRSKRTGRRKIAYGYRLTVHV